MATTGRSGESGKQSGPALPLFAHHVGG